MDREEQQQPNTLQFIDCHSHLADVLFDQDFDKVIQRAKENGVVASLVCAITAAESEKVLELAERYPDFCMPCLGVHPAQPVKTADKDAYDQRSVNEMDLQEVIPWIEKHHEKIVAIGEVGLDFSPRLCNQDGDKEAQRTVLRRQVELSKKFDLPLNVHSRSAGRPTIELLKEAGAEKVLLHAFDGRPAVAMTGVEAGYYFSIPPSIVRSEQKQKLVQRIPLENMVLETDSPALGPVKQERNEPANIRLSCEYIAKIKKIDVETVSRVTYENSLKLFTRLRSLLKR